ncbi:tetratricopeptide repeat protein [Balneolaceae bacterium YR4-1]|uniref:Tetratricopeptide repeat protein n=1 Tax=Halalkalibaculum roseum TaxID=2709311 RepID=A0A6M1SYE1_9BACT|nr:tetratricopeptide repeat protein [Halalkalibaculum roseum]NGP78100.1 tetratricopeptide repeat protein [Halalkalibaculum roseum]
MKYRLLLFSIISLSLMISLVYSCGTRENDTRNQGLDFKSPFIGDQECASCHSDQYRMWKGSHHFYAMNEATSNYVRGDFNGEVFRHNGVTYKFYKKADKYFVETEGLESKNSSYEVAYTFGWEPLQQYLLDFGSGKYQALNIAWDTQEKQWFALNPEQDLEHGNWLHWTGGAMNWNTMCADCHSTNLQQNYIAEADSFNTTWSSINVSCESCHGGGRDHVSFMQSEEAAEATIERIREDLLSTKTTSQVELIKQCAPCHSLREKLTSDYSHDTDFLDHFNPTLPHPESYFADGQIKEEVYVYGSFLQSKMYKQDVKCNDCHDPHSLDLKANVKDNTLCMSCHENSYDSPEHHFHKLNTEASQCINCHMPGRFYMEVDFRRDHSFRVPRPDQSVLYDVPNACNNCHESESPQWASNWVKEWYGTNRSKHFSDVLLKADSLDVKALPDLQALIADTSQPEIARATAVWYTGQFPSEESLEILESAIQSETALVRLSGAKALSALPSEMKMLPLQDLLDDEERSVRNAAISGLTEFTVVDISSFAKQSFKKALEEYEEYLDVNRYFPQGEMNRGQYFEKSGKIDEAIKAYKEAIKKDSEFLPARINLAYLYNQIGQNQASEDQLDKVLEIEPSYGPAYYSMALLKAEQNNLKESLQYFEEGANLMPENHRLRYNWAISLQRLDMPERAEEIYLEALELAPDNVDYLYGLVTLYFQQKEYEKALYNVEKLLEIAPENQRFLQLQNLIIQRSE